MYYSVYVLSRLVALHTRLIHTLAVCVTIHTYMVINISVQYNGGFLPDINAGTFDVPTSYQ